MTLQAPSPAPAERSPRYVLSCLLLAGVVVHAQAGPPAAPAQTEAAEAAAPAALAMPVNAGTIPFLITSANYTNVANRLAGALAHERADVRAVAARSIALIAGKRYGDAVTAALAAEKDPIAGAEMVRALLAIRGAAADREAIAAARRFGAPAMNAITVSLAHTRPLDVLPWLADLDLDTDGLADALIRATAVDATRVTRAIEALPPGVKLSAVEHMRGRARDTADPRWTQREGWRSLDPFLNGLPAAVAEAAECRLDRNELASVNIVYGDRGQVRSVNGVNGAASPACRKAAGLLALLEIAPVGAGAPAGRIDHIVVALTREATGCTGQRPSRRQAVRPGADPRIVEPVRVRNVDPVYPQQLIAARVQGVVVIEAEIDRVGCVGALTVVEPAHPELMVAALAAVQQWRFSQTLLNGEPVPVIMTTKVNFSLK